MTGPLLPGAPLLRTRPLVVLYIFYLGLLLRILVTPVIGAAEVRATLNSTPAASQIFQ